MIFEIILLSYQLGNPSYMTIYFVTRHPGTLQWAQQNHLKFDIHLEHLTDLNSLQAQDIVIGILPINMVYQLNCRGVRYIHLSLQMPAQLRGMELDPQQLNACHATLEEFVVQKGTFDLHILD